ncbi:MAG: histidine phosphatase family protein [Firmicutes bacterium]|nr:histidine phosphatase family protein [Bacillota bacterium]
MTKILLIRHGETVWNKEKRYQGQKDSPLSDEGIRQGQKTGAFLAQQEIAAVYSSDLSRAVWTAEAISGHHGLTPIQDQRIREMSFGVWEGMTREEIKQKFPDIFYARYRDSMNTRVPGGELPHEVVERFHAFLNELIKTHVSETVVVVSHGGCLRFTIAALLSIPLEKSYCLHLSNAGISELQYVGADRQCPWEAITINSTGHLT